MDVQGWFRPVFYRILGRIKLHSSQICHTEADQGLVGQFRFMHQVVYTIPNMYHNQNYQPIFLNLICIIIKHYQTIFI